MYKCFEMIAVSNVQHPKFWVGMQVYILFVESNGNPDSLVTRIPTTIFFNKLISMQSIFLTPIWVSLIRVECIWWLAPLRMTGCLVFIRNVNGWKDDFKKWIRIFRCFSLLHISVWLFQSGQGSFNILPVVLWTSSALALKAFLGLYFKFLGFCIVADCFACFGCFWSGLVQRFMLMIPKT